MGGVFGSGGVLSIRFKTSSPFFPSTFLSVSDMAVLYVDEAGEEGFKDSSSEWFILGGALHSNNQLKECVDCYDAFKGKRRQAEWHFHFQTRSHDERLGFIEAITKAPYQAMAVMFHKPSITKPENFKKKYYLYFYALKFLLERATKWADQTAKEPIHLMLSSRKGLDEDNLKSYFNRIRTSPFVPKDDILWDILRHEEIHIKPNKEYRGLQVADLVASSIFKAVEKSEYGTLEPRYIKELRPLFERDPYKGFQATTFWPAIPFFLSTERMQWREI